MAERKLSKREKNNYFSIAKDLEYPEAMPDIKERLMSCETVAEANRIMITAKNLRYPDRWVRRKAG